MLKFDDTLDFSKKSIDVFAIGELLVDMISTEYDDLNSNTYSKYFGGSPANIAMNISKLGANATIFSCVGKDNLGDFLVNHLENNQINTEYISRADFPTSMVLVTKSKDTPIPVFYRGADYNLEYNSILKEAISKSKIIHFSCWPISQEKSRNTIEKAIVEARKNDTIIGFDPNYHEMIWEKGHDGIEYIKNIVNKVDIIKPSEVDAERIFGVDTPENQIAKFINLGAKLVIMTLGKDGAIVSDGTEIMKFKTLATEIVDTTGAGDAFWSGFYTGLAKGNTVKKSLELGFAVSAFKLKFVGAIAPLPRIDEIEKIYLKKGAF